MKFNDTENWDNGSKELIKDLRGKVNMAVMQGEVVVKKKEDKQNNRVRVFYFENQCDHFCNVIFSVRTWTKNCIV